MSTNQYVKDVYAAIMNVRRRIKVAETNADKALYERLVGDLIALDVCLVIETGKHLDELDKEAA